MKKKITAIFLCVALVAIAIVGASLAYFTDTKSATNTFAVGNVKIELIEQQRGENGLEHFESGKTLLPGTSDKNAVSKIVTVKNTGANDAWVWVDMLIPSYLLDAANPTNQSLNALHFNEYGAFNQAYWQNPIYKLSETNSAVTDGVFKADLTPAVENMVNCDENTVWTDWVSAGTTTVGEGNKAVTYTILRTKMVGTLESGKISLPCLRQVYMDWRVQVDGEQYILPNGSTIPTNASWEIIVNAYAIQADGFDTVDAAIAGYTSNGN